MPSVKLRHLYRIFKSYRHMNQIKISEEFYHLISSLTKNEKRDFHIHLRTYDGDTMSKECFRLLCQNAIQSDEEMLTYIESPEAKRAWTQTKRYLFNKIIANLRRLNKDAENEASSLVIQANILAERGLYMAAVRRLKKALDIADEHDFSVLKLWIIEHLEKIPCAKLPKNYKDRDVIDTDKLTDQRQKLAKEIYEVGEMEFRYEQSEEVFNTYFVGAPDSVWLKYYRQHFMPTSERAGLLKKKSGGNRLFFIKDPSQSVVIWSGIVDKNPDDYYAKYKLGLSLFMRQDFQDLRTFLGTLDINKANLKEQMRIISLWQILLNNYLTAGIPLPYVDLGDIELSECPAAIEFVFISGCRHHFLGNTVFAKKAFTSISQLHNPKYRVDIIAASKIMHCLLVYESGDNDWAVNLLRSGRKYLERKGLLGEIEKRSFSVIKSLIDRYPPKIDKLQKAIEGADPFVVNYYYKSLVNALLPEPETRTA